MANIVNIKIVYDEFIVISMVSDSVLNFIYLFRFILFHTGNIKVLI